MPDTAFRATLFQVGTLEAAGLRARRKQGRPRLAWGPVIRAQARLAIGDALGPSLPLRPPPPPLPASAPSPESAVLGIFLGPARYKKTVWKAMVKRHVFAM